MQKIVNTKTLIRSAVSIAIAGAISLTSCYANPTPAPKPVETEPAPIVQTEPVIPKYTVKGVTFHDYNGDGIHQEIEPLVPGVFLRFSNTDNVTTNEKGMYEIALSGDKYELTLPDKVLGPNDQPFRYVSISKEDFKSIKDYSKMIDAENDLNCDLGLMQGFMTLPFSKDTKLLDTDHPLGIIYYVDRNWRKNYIKAWDGSEITYDNHNGTDFMMEENTPILAVASGIVVRNPYPYNINSGQVVYIKHENAYDGSAIITGYVHMNESKVKPGDKVKRGDVIGLSGRSVFDGPYNSEHLHFSVYLLESLSPMKLLYTDPYRSVVPIETSSSVSINKYVTIGAMASDYMWVEPLLGLWSKDNNPQYP